MCEFLPRFPRQHGRPSGLDHLGRDGVKGCCSMQRRGMLQRPVTLWSLQHAGWLALLHTAQTAMGAYDFGPGLFLHPPDSATTTCEVANHVSHGFIGDNDFDIHDRFEQDGLSAFGNIFEGHGGSNLKGHL